MNVEKISPYVCHILVCVNDRQGARKSCADDQGVEIRAAFKAAVAARGWKPRVRVSQCGCMGLCESGPNVLIYPQGLWYSEVVLADVPTLLEKVAALLAAHPPGAGD